MSATRIPKEEHEARARRQRANKYYAEMRKRIRHTRFPTSGDCHKCGDHITHERMWVFKWRVLRGADTAWVEHCKIMLCDICAPSFADALGYVERYRDGKGQE